MRNYTKNVHKCQDSTLKIATQISFWVDGVGVEWFDVGLPHPNYFEHINKGYYIAWNIRGYNSAYIDELKVRFVQTLAPARVEELELNRECNNVDTIYDLKDFKALQSIKSRAQSIVRHQNLFICDDVVFLHLKFYFEHLIKKDGVPVYSDFENWALKEYRTKEKSTIKAKCRSIYHWYSNRNFKTGRVKFKDKDLVMATRQAHAKKIHTKLANDTKRKVLNIITGMFSHEYKFTEGKRAGKWNVAKIAKDSGTTRPTVMKYLPKDSLF